MSLKDCRLSHKINFVVGIFVFSQTRTRSRHDSQMLNLNTITRDLTLTCCSCWKNSPSGWKFSIFFVVSLSVVSVQVGWVVQSRVGRERVCVCRRERGSWQKRLRQDKSNEPFFVVEASLVSFCSVASILRKVFLKFSPKVSTQEKIIGKKERKTIARKSSTRKRKKILHTAVSCEKRKSAANQLNQFENKFAISHTKRKVKIYCLFFLQKNLFISASP